MELDNLAIFNTITKNPLNAGVLLLTGAFCCYLGIWVEMLDETYAAEIGLGFWLGIAFIIVAGFRWLVEAIRKRL